MRLLVSGTRHQSEEIRRTVRDELNWYLREWGRELFLILGGAAGVDRYAQEWAENYNISHVILYARWDDFGRSAGMIRNKEMFKQNPDQVICFPAPDSVGTLGVISLANKRGIKPRKVDVTI